MNLNKTLNSRWMAVCLLLACGCSVDSDTNVQIEFVSEYPIAVDVGKVGSYPMQTKSGAGYFYDDVLEYRVWIDSPDGDYYKAFASFERAQEFSDKTLNAEKPLVLVFQKEHVNEPEPGTFEHVKTDRITEWQVEWLDGNKRTANSIPKFLLENGS